MCDFFQERLLKVLKGCNFVWVQQRHNCSPAASFANCVMTLCLLKVHPQTFLSIPISQKCQILSCDTLVANDRHIQLYIIEPKHMKGCEKRNTHISSKLRTIYISSNNVGHPVIKTFTTLHYTFRHFTPSHLNFTHLYFTTLFDTSLLPI